MPELNPALQDIEAIVDKPKLTPKEWEVVSKASDWIKATQRPEVRIELEIEYTQKYAAFETEMRLETQKLVKQSMEDWRKEQEPLSTEELSKLLSQEYVDFPVMIKVRGRKGVKPSVKNFTICELPQEMELRFVKIAQKSLVPIMEQINSAEWKLDGSVIEQIIGVLNNIPLALDTAAELVAICLDPWEEDDEINADWVKKNVGSVRIQNILIAQSEANKYRDFFLNGSRTFRSLTKK